MLLEVGWWDGCDWDCGGCEFWVFGGGGFGCFDFAVGVWFESDGLGGDDFWWGLVCVAGDDFA